jgi:hypothetical protein
MNNTYKFITHIVSNLFPLNEYSEGEMSKLMDKFKEEANDFNIHISDEQLKKYIERFDQLKNSPKIEDKDLRRWPLSKLIKLVTSSEGVDDEEEQGPDVLYSENGYTIYSGGNEELCQRHRNEVPWCITRTSFGNYRYSKDRNYPSFYLIKNTNLPDSNKLSFVAIQVKDNGKYVWTPRDNSPNESQQMDWGKLTSDIPWLNDIPNIKNILKHIPLSASEKTSQVYGKHGGEISIRKWVTFPFNEKKQYLVVRKNKGILFDDITSEEFISKILPKYPQLASFIATNADILDPISLIKNLSNFSPNDRKSIIANLRNNIDLKELSKDNLPFDVKKLLVTLKKWNISTDQRMYVTKNGEAIVLLNFETAGNISVGVYTQDDDYPNIKLNKRTSKFLLDYPEIDKLPFNTIIKLANDEVIDPNFINKILTQAQENPNLAISITDTKDGKIILDSNSFTSYKLKDGKITSISFDDEEIQNILSQETDNTSFQQSAIDLIYDGQDLPKNIEIDSLVNLINSSNYTKRTKEGSVILISPPDNESDYRIFLVPNNINEFRPYVTGYDKLGFFRKEKSIKDYTPYFTYLRSIGQSFTDDQFMNILDAIEPYNRISKKSFISSNPPLTPNSQYFPTVYEDQYIILNKRNPSQSLIISPKSGKIIKFNIPPRLAANILGTNQPQNQPTQTPTTQPTQPAVTNTARGRGRPAGGARPIAPVVQGGTGTEQQMEARGLRTAWNGLPTSIRTRLSNISPEQGLSRGASRRNNQLGNRGRVTSTWSAGPSSIYFISLSNGTVIASINIQPGNGNYILIPNQEPIRLNSPTELLSALQIVDLAEVLIAEFMVSNPAKLTETKKILNYYIKSKNRKK